MNQYNEAQLNKVIRYCNKWGVEVLVKSPCPFHTKHLGPVWGRLDWEEHKIFWPLDEEMRPQRVRANAWPAALLHELAHCLAFEPPSWINEPISEMLAFEYFSLRYLKIYGWGRWMKDYGMPDGRAWQRLSNLEKHDYLDASLDLAREVGILNRDRTPTFQPPWRREHGQN
jgi:hypothetical protein